MTNAVAPIACSVRTRVGLALLPLLALTLLAVPGPAPARAQMISFIRDTEIERLLNDYAQPIFRAANLGGGQSEQLLIEQVLAQYKANLDLDLGTRENLARSMARSASAAASCAGSSDSTPR